MKWILYHLGFLFLSSATAEEHMAKVAPSFWSAFSRPEII